MKQKAIDAKTQKNKLNKKLKNYKIIIPVLWAVFIIVALLAMLYSQNATFFSVVNIIAFVVFTSIIFLNFRRFVCKRKLNQLRNKNANKLKKDPKDEIEVDKEVE